MDTDDDEFVWERPLECCECKKPVDTCYTEAVGNTITRYGMCKDCPVLHKKISGEVHYKKSVAHMCCGTCGTRLEEVQVGGFIGCPLCYELFAEEIYRELEQIERVPAKTTPFKKGVALHCGRAPGEQKDLDPSLKLLSLQQALQDTLGREDYEQAARLRDQIRTIEKGKGGDGK